MRQAPSPEGTNEILFAFYLIFTKPEWNICVQRDCKNQFMFWL